jgi:cation diffusion facilitator family transporter
MTHAPPLTRFAWFSIATAVAVISLKGGAYLLTGSVGLLSDALESLVNLAAAIMALAMLTVAARPPDEEHAYGHHKAEYFASGFEGALILFAALSIIYTSTTRLFDPRPIEEATLGLGLAAVASLLNVAMARVLAEAGRRYRSITLEANGRHLMTDVWTSGGVIVGVGAAAATGWHWLDPVVGMAVAAHILGSGASLLRRSAHGLLDTALPEVDRREIREVLGHYEAAGVQFHALRTRQAGRHRFVSMHVLVPGEWSVQRGHELLEEIEARIVAALPECSVFTHLEPVEDPVSFQDALLTRTRAEDPPAPPPSPPR